MSGVCESGSVAFRRDFARSVLASALESSAAESKSSQAPVALCARARPMFADFWHYSSSVCGVCRAGSCATNVGRNSLHCERGVRCGPVGLAARDGAEELVGSMQWLQSRSPTWDTGCRSCYFSDGVRRSGRSISHIHHAGIGCMSVFLPVGHASACAGASSCSEHLRVWSSQHTARQVAHSR